jgi:tetratricopeptide (TPR) repeat protein
MSRRVAVVLSAYDFTFSTISTSQENDHYNPLTLQSIPYKKGSTMNVRKTKAWKNAQFEYEELITHISVPFFGHKRSPEEIIDRLEIILKGCPKFYPARLELALRILTSGGGKSAERQLEEGFHLMLELAESEHLDGELDILFENLEKLWRFDLSTHLLKVLVERYPHNALFLDYLAHATARLGDIEGALLHIAKAVQLEPDSLYFKSNKGWIHLMAGNLKEAGEALEAALLLGAGDKVVKGNLEIHQYLIKHGGNYFNYLLRPVEEEKIEQLKDAEDWEEVDRLFASYNTCRFEALAQDLLLKNSPMISGFADMLATLEQFFIFVQKVDQDTHLNEDLEFMQDEFKPIMHKFIFKMGDVDHEMLEEIYEALLAYYDFLAYRDLVSSKEFKRFKKKILGMKKELINKMERYNAIRHSSNISEDEKEAIRDELFEGDHTWPFL